MGVRLPSRRPSPSAVAPSAHVSRHRRILPTRGPSRAGAGSDWPEPAFVAVAEKLDAARKARAATGTDHGEEEMGRTEVIGGVGGGAVEEPLDVAFAPFEKSLLAVDRVGTMRSASRSALGFEEMSTYVIYGTGAFFAGWILSAIVSAIDSIPLLPKLLEIVGLGYTLWFSTRYLLFKENRDELLVKVKDLKKRTVGSGDE